MNSSVYTKYVFSQPMLATWAVCCIAFGVSISLVGVDKGWINFVGSAKKENKPTSKGDSGMDAKTQAQITDMLLNTGAAKECIGNPDEWKRVPYFWPIGRDPNRKGPAAFVPGLLHGHDKLSTEPVTFINRDRRQFVILVHLGKSLCGHDGIIHGGVQATLLDEITARPAFWNLPRNIALTANLKINYLRPVMADQILVFRTQLVDVDGRKAKVAATLEDTSGNILTDAESLYISPSNEKLLQDRSSEVKKLESIYPGNF
ncbi:hypothetical protein IW140_005107 [Coemansia sp. RSA 1813]|nr:hypothetical protein EV178_005002 [Coemansia sp. RSA 1646]KAJ1767793.1 hypothetical protein LPJ74_005180 [Coemansia sp. RSA 1843]KAJ2087157.1 hypothetical protein IW138_005144 [Coemansia sp. RSA 986]KAJ2212002.1 hypothetical protein EV179_005046 [Coemansia sp. RSA 487]KAJ2565952.1 hypothetical protein IW140_005107 [Coemansia sp. RSA 1813]